MIKVIPVILALLLAVGLWFVVRAESQLQNESRFEEPVAVAVKATGSPTERAPLPATPSMVSALPPLQAADAAGAAGFGASLAAWGETIAVGAPRADDGAGAVYLFQWDGERWREDERLTAGDGAANDAFGQSVAIEGGTLLVGASGHDGSGWEAGAVYVFERDGDSWRQQEKLAPRSQDVRFGWAVALAGEIAVVGAPQRFSQGELLNVGSATIFATKDWQEQARLTTGKSGGAATSDLFGWSVAAHGATVAVGAHLADAVYVYHLDGGQWRQETVLSHGARGNQFGYSVALGQNSLVVGAPAADTNGPQSGTAVLFSRTENRWQEAAALAPHNLGTGARLGTAVALGNNVVAVGAREGDSESDIEAAGATYLFEVVNGRPIARHALFAAAPMESAFFGHAVAFLENVVVVGAPADGGRGGRVDLFVRE